MYWFLNTPIIGKLQTKTGSNDTKFKDISIGYCYL